MMLIRFGSLLVIGLALVASHAGRTPASAQGSGPFPRTVTDSTGRRVTVPALPARIAVVDGAPEVRAVVERGDLRTLDPLDDPASIDWFGVGLLVLSDLHAAINPAWMDTAAARGIPVFQVSEISSLDGWRGAVEAVGQATGRDAQAVSVLARLENRLKRLVERLATEPLRRALVLSPEGYTFGQGTLITDLLTALGAQNAAAEAGIEDYRQVDDDAIRRLAPDVILLTPSWTDEQVAQFRSNRALAAVPAIRRNQVFRVPFSPTLPHDPAAAMFILALALYPTALLH